MYVNGEVSLTGRNVTLAKVQGLVVTAGSLVYPIAETPINDCGQVYAYFSTKDTAHAVNFYLVPRHKFQDGTYQNADANISKTGSLQFANTGVLAVDSPYYRITFQNNDTVNHTYDFVLGGIK
jgi:hypothetical protein